MNANHSEIATTTVISQWERFSSSRTMSGDWITTNGLNSYKTNIWSTFERARLMDFWGYTVEENAKLVSLLGKPEAFSDFDEAGADR